MIQRLRNLWANNSTLILVLMTLALGALVVFANEIVHFLLALC